MDTPPRSTCAVRGQRVQDRLERARRQAASGLGVMGQLFGQVQTLITILSLAAGLAVFAPWLILLLLVALIPAFLGEAHFNAQGYALPWSRAAGTRAAGLPAADRCERRDGQGSEDLRPQPLPGRPVRALSARLLSRTPHAGRRARRVDGACSPRSARSATTGRTRSSPGARSAGQFTIGDLTFLAGSFRRLRGLLEALLIGFSYTASQALYLDDLFSFFELTPTIRSPARARSPCRVRCVQGIEFRDVGFRYPGHASGGRCGTCPSASRRARCWPSWARTAPARPRS